MSEYRGPFRRLEGRETLERIARWPSLMARFSRVRIYSAEWGAFWRNTGQGYTGDSAESAVWSTEKAFARTRHCGPEKKIQFVGTADPLAACELEETHGRDLGPPNRRTGQAGQAAMDVHDPPKRRTSPGEMQARAR